MKKVKSYSSRRPITASYYGASQKVMTLFDKDTTSKNKCETIRIHSNKEIDPKAISIKDVKFLKTFSFNAINRSKRGSKKFQDNSGN